MKIIYEHPLLTTIWLMIIAWGISEIGNKKGDDK